MTARDYKPQKGDRLKRNTFYTSLYPYNIEIEKITRSGHVHYYELKEGKRTGRHGSTSLTVLRKLFEYKGNVNEIHQTTDVGTTTTDAA
jgi:hypothetical protein